MKVTKLTSKQANAQKLIYDILTNNGVVGIETEQNDALSLQFDFNDVFSMDKVMKNENINDFKDAFYTEDLTRFIGTAVTSLVQEAIEPDLLVVPNLFKQINYEGPGRTVEIGAVGAFHAAEVPEGQEYPEADMSFGDGHIIQLGIAKHGLKLRVTQEVIDDNLFDVFGMWLRMAGRALARHKEEYGIALLNDMGQTVFSNSDTAGDLGFTKGRGIDGKFNGSMTINDVFDMWAYGYLRGFNYDTLIMNPLAWKTFMNDPKMREILFSNGVIATNRNPNGTGAKTFGTGFGGLGYKQDPTGRSNQQTANPAGPNPFVTSLNPLGATFQIAPKYLPSPLKVIVSPHVKYGTGATGGGASANIEDDSSVYVTDVIMADSMNAGLLMTKEGVSVDEWKDPEVDIHAMKIKERWGMALLAQGKGVGVAKDIVIKDNYVFENTNTATLTETGPANAIVD
jgi:hypothetical protein